MGKIKPSYDSFILDLVVGGLESESKGVLHVNLVRGGGGGGGGPELDVHRFLGNWRPYRRIAARWVGRAPIE